MKDIRIGVIGTENSHARIFASLINNKNDDGEFNFPGFKVTLVYGEYPEESKKMEEFGCTVVNSLEDMVGNVDAVMITARDGAKRLEFARPFIEKGIAAFIDKPFTASVKDALELVRIAKANNALLSGGSSIKHSRDIEFLRLAREEFGDKVVAGNVAGEIQIDSEYSGFWFYSPHATEMCLSVFGSHPKSVLADLNGKSVCAIVNYDNFQVAVNYIEKGHEIYSATVYAPFDLEHRTINGWFQFENECRTFVDMIKTGKMKQSYEELIAPVFVTDAIIKSYETGKKIEIKYEEI